MRLQLLGFDTHTLFFHFFYLSPFRRFMSLWILMQPLCSNSRMVFLPYSLARLFNTGLAGQCTSPTGL